MSKMNAIRIYKVIVVAVLIGLVSTSSAVEETWTGKADMPTARFSLTTSVVDGRIYAIGGGKTPYGAYLSTVEEYDPATDTWTTKADMPTARSGHAASVVNGKIYIIGGSPSAETSIATVEVYDPVTDTWAAKAAMPIKRTFLCSCAVDGKIYVFGGVTAGVPGATWNPLALDVYDPTSNTWETRGNIPTPRGLASACVVNGKIYMIGGVVGDLEGAPLSTMDEYDPATDTWTRKNNMPTARVWSSSSVANGKIYVIGGVNFGGPVFSKVEEYDPTTDTWITKLDMPTRRGMLSTSVVNRNIYAIGGTRIWWPWTGTSKVEKYTPPLTVDFNGDGIVDISDLLRLIESWGQDDPIVDIAPPLGDGVIDVFDLEVLMNHWLQEVIDPTLEAHWKLDESEGDTAHDSIEGNDGFGPPDLLWRPEDGKVGGALELDGIDDSIITTFSLNPIQTAFSAFVWVKGGGPEQVALSQRDGVDWLLADSEGRLITALRRGHFGSKLTSEYVITDGNWHHIGVVWDGTHRYLYADGIVVAEDTTNLGYLSASDGNLCIGCGSAFDLGSFFSGLIDDVRIYNVAISAEKIEALAW
jgi:N-acetylneuraminic acid mutarotase